MLGEVHCLSPIMISWMRALETGEVPARDRASPTQLMMDMSNHGASSHFKVKERFRTLTLTSTAESLYGMSSLRGFRSSPFLGLLFMTDKHQLAPLLALRLLQTAVRFGGRPQLCPPPDSSRSPAVDGGICWCRCAVSRWTPGDC
jgi:hypothetical protein